MSALVRRSAKLTAVVALGVAVLAGCGKSHSNGSSTVSPGSGGSTTSPSSSSTTGSGGGYGY
jgi:hypothetical protein